MLLAANTLFDLFKIILEVVFAAFFIVITHAVIYRIITKNRESKNAEVEIKYATRNKLGEY